MEQAAEATAAAVGGMVSAGTLFPLEVIKTNLQAKTKMVKTAQTMTTGGEGAGGKKRTAASVHHEEESLAIETGGKASENDMQSKEGRQDGDRYGLGVREAEKPATMLSVASEIFHCQGLGGFYEGVVYASGQSAVEKAAYFYGYSWLKAAVLQAQGRGGSGLSTIADLGLGYLAEAFHLPFTIPIEVVLTKIMTSRESTNALAVIQGILAESGPGGFYKGIQAYVVLCLKPAIQYAVFNRFKAWKLAYETAKAATRGERPVTELSAAQAFVIGAISRAVATVIVFPYIRAKVIIMSRKHDTAEGGRSTGAGNVSILGSLITILKEEGVSALFQGITPEITRGVLSAALMLMVKEKIHTVVKGTMVGER
ncbi:unnamed protein product [Choristocarpus tenellus]